MLIREMTLEDIAQAAEIENICFSQPWSENSFKDSVTREDTLFLVCEESSQTVFDKTNEEKQIHTDVPACDEPPVIAGYIGMYLSFDEASITNVAVAPSHRKKGYGKQLVSAAKTKAKEKQVERIYLEVRVSNEPAIALYQKMGFENLGIRKNFYDHPKEDAYIMCCDISSLK